MSRLPRVLLSCAVASSLVGAACGSADRALELRSPQASPTANPTPNKICGAIPKAADEVNLRTELDLEEGENGIPAGFLTVRNESDTDSYVRWIGSSAQAIAHAIAESGEVVSTGAISFNYWPPVRIGAREEKRVRVTAGTRRCERASGEERLQPAEYTFAVLLLVSKSAGGSTMIYRSEFGRGRLEAP